jgi:hypothetical protein
MEFDPKIKNINHTPQPPHISSALPGIAEEAGNSDSSAPGIRGLQNHDRIQDSTRKCCSAYGCPKA